MNQDPGISANTGEVGDVSLDKGAGGGTYHRANDFQCDRKIHRVCHGEKKVRPLAKGMQGA